MCAEVCVIIVLQLGVVCTWCYEDTHNGRLCAMVLHSGVALFKTEAAYLANKINHKQTDFLCSCSLCFFFLHRFKHICWFESVILKIIILLFLQYLVCSCWSNHQSVRRCTRSRRGLNLRLKSQHLALRCIVWLNLSPVTSWAPVAAPPRRMGHAFSSVNAHTEERKTVRRTKGFPGKL